MSATADDATVYCDFTALVSAVISTEEKRI